MLRVSLSLTAALAMAATAPAQTIRNYNVNRTTTTPTIDGIVSPGEWSAAATAAGDWREFRQPFSDVDTDNNRFRMQYDANNLYILYETAYDFGWLAPLFDGNPGISFGEESLNLYIDPNRDGDLNTNSLGDPLPPGIANGDTVDGYQLSFNQHLGAFLSTGANRQGIGFFTEAHVNTPFGDQGNWNQGGEQPLGAALNGSGIRVAQVNTNTPTGGQSRGVAEIVIPFVDLDAEVSIGAQDSIGALVPTGLNATDGGTRSGPVAGEVWGFNIAQISRDIPNNFLPIWNWHDAQSFALWPHGTITFQAAIPEPTSALLLTMAIGAALARRRR